MRENTASLSVPLLIECVPPHRKFNHQPLKHYTASFPSSTSSNYGIIHRKLHSGRHSVPISFTPTNRATIAELCRENTIKPIVVESTRCFGYPVENNQSHGSIVINLKDKNLASKIAKGYLFYNGLPLNGAPYKKWLFIL
ncbi:hypothetical protein PSTG_14678 [Puccinia striiformis f. sp. tritici PST-78]|uniref:Uncharacterized protein n=1 Tax=Puccinia striiformis f. sp. tritici PST-78 TaxID=1165861 RepID=A0A0L0UYW3_9BASI|nr:hypothetical protein PSTG_14678 [Puccinia striiformis f. sp. tritici PST-78]